MVESMKGRRHKRPEISFLHNSSLFCLFFRFLMRVFLRFPPSRNFFFMDFRGTLCRVGRPWSDGVHVTELLFLSYFVIFSIQLGSGEWEVAKSEHDIQNFWWKPNFAADSELLGMKKVFSSFGAFYSISWPFHGHICWGRESWMNLLCR